MWRLEKKYFALIVAVLIPLFGIAQLKIKGKISSSEDQAPIAFATIQVGNNHKTISNESGEFELTINALPALLKISHTSFQAVQLEKADQNPLNITLKPVILSLKEVVVGNYGLTLMKNAFVKAKETYQDSHYAKAFLRQIAYENDNPSYLNEIYFNADWKNYGLVKWQPTQTRHLKAKGMISYNNLSFFSMSFSGFLFNNVHVKPLTGKLDSLYNFKLKATYQLGDAEIGIVSCQAKVKIDKMYFEGDYYINTATADVIKIEGTIKNMNMKSSGPISIKNMGIEFMAQYKLSDAGKNVLDFSTLNMKNKLSVMGIKAKESYFSCTLFMIDYNDKYNKDLKDINLKTNDVTTTKEMAYDANFWNVNETVKRTDKEQAAIKVLEAVKKVKP